MQPTPARSPTAKPVTALPTALTRPTISWPGTQGQRVPGHSPRAVCRSEWHTPQCRMSICTSRGPGARRPMANGASGVSAECAAKARTGADSVGRAGDASGDRQALQVHHPAAERRVVAEAAVVAVAEAHGHGAGVDQRLAFGPGELHLHLGGTVF